MTRGRKPGYHQTEETKAKLSAARKGKPLSEEHKQALRGKRKPCTEEHKKKISEARKGCFFVYDEDGNKHWGH